MLFVAGNIFRRMDAVFQVSYEKFLSDKKTRRAASALLDEV